MSKSLGQDYFDKKLEHELGKARRIYSETYFKETARPNILGKIRYQKQLYDAYYESLTKGFSEDRTHGTAELVLYGPDDEPSAMKDLAIQHFLTTLTLKGFTYTTKKKKRSFVDFMEGMCTECKQIIQYTKI